SGLTSTEPAPQNTVAATCRTFSPEAAIAGVVEGPLASPDRSKKGPPSMTRARLAGCALAILAWASAPLLRADDPPTPAKTAQGPYVVLVGVGDYADKAISARPTADADAKALYDLFADPKYAIAAKDRVVLLTSEPDAGRGSQKATRDNILAALKTAVTKT